jgi:hypothetical protein
MVLKDLKKGTTFSVGTSLDLKCTSSENSKKILVLEFDRIE